MSTAPDALLPILPALCQGCGREGPPPLGDHSKASWCVCEGTPGPYVIADQAAARAARAAKLWRRRAQFADEAVNALVELHDTYADTPENEDHREDLWQLVDRLSDMARRYGELEKGAPLLAREPS